VDVHFPRCCRAPHPPPLARALSLALVLAPPVARAARPADPSLVLVAVVLARAAGAGC